MATTVTRYVNTASSGGDGTTNATSGANAAYASLAAWATAMGATRNIVSLDETHVVNCTGGADAISSGIDLSGWTTDATRKVLIQSSDTRSAGTFASAYRVSTSSSGVNGFTLPAYSALVNIFYESTATSADNRGVVSAGTNITLDRCWVRKNSNGGNWYAINPNASTSITARNCILDTTVNASSGASCNAVFSFYVSSSDVNLYNCTLANFRNSGAGGTAVHKEGGGNVTLTNCAIFRNDSDVVNNGGAGTITTTYCASDDTLTGTGNVNISPGATEATDWAAAFTDYANYNYSVKDASSVLYNAGTSLSGSGVTADFMGTSRPQSTSYDIGAFEYSASGGGSGSPVLMGQCVY